MPDPEKPRYPEPPTSWSKAPVEKPKRSWRGFWLGVLATVALAILLPLVVYLAALIYIKTGGVERAVNAAVKESLGPGASTGSVATTGIESLRINELNLPSSDGDPTPALQVKTVKIFWDPYALAMQKHVRAVEVEKPSLALRCDADGRWNFVLPPSKPSAYWIDQVQVSGGTLGLEWAPGRRVDLTGVRVMMTRAQPPMPQPVTIYAQWPSKSELHAEAVLGPGAALKASLSGSIDPSIDLAFVGWPADVPKGRVTYRFDTLREWSIYSGTAGDLTFEGRLDLKDFRWTVANGLTLVAPDRRVELRARLPEPGLVSRPTVEDVALEVGGLGSLSGRLFFPKSEGTTPSGEQAVFEKGRVRLAIQSLPQWFEGLNPLKEWTKDGDLVLEDLKVVLPLEQPEALTYQAKIQLPELNLDIPGAGELPALKFNTQVNGSLKGAKVSGADVAFGEIGHLVFDAQANWGDLKTAWLELLKVVNVHAFDLDLGALLRTEVGRRLLGGGWGKRDAPAMGELPVLAQGKLSARALKTDVRQDGNTTTISWSGIRAAELEIKRSPLPVDLSELQVSGDLSGEISVVGSTVNAIRVSGVLTGSANPPSTGRFVLRADHDPQGRWMLSGADVPSLRIPVNNLLRIFGLQSYVNCTGLLTLTDGAYDATAQSAAGLVRFEDLSAEKMGAMIKGLGGQARVTFKDGKLTAKGRIEPSKAFILTKVIPLSAMELTLSASMGANGQWQEFAANLGWENGDHFAIGAVVTQPDRTSVRLVGRIETSFWGGLKGGYDLTADTGGFDSSGWERWKVGPLVLKLENFDLGQLAETPLGAYVPTTLKMSGKLPKLNLEASPFFLAELRTGRPGSTVVTSGEFENLNVVYSPSSNELDRSEADHLTGTFRGELGFEPGSAGFSCNVLTTVRDYEMLLDPRYLVFLGNFKPNERFYIPPPKTKEKLVAQLVGQIQPQKSGTLDVRVHKLLVDMFPRLRLSSSGRLTVPANWDVFGKGEGVLSDVEIGSSNLEALNRDLLQLNIGRRAPDLKLSGAFTYKGRHVWSSDRSALTGEILFNNVNAANTGWAATGLNGRLPLSLHQGLWPADWPREQRGTLTLGAVDRPPLHIPQQPIAIVAAPNVLSVLSPVKATVTGGEVQLEDLQIQNVLSGAPTIDFGFRVNALRFADLAAAQKVVFNGLQGYGPYPPAVLTGFLSPCRLWREPSVLGTWNLITNGTLTAPFFQGEMQLTGLYSRDCLGLTPVIGVRELKIDGMSIGSLTAQNAVHGHVKVDVDLKITGFEMLGLDLEGVRKFRMEVKSIPKPDKEYFFERSFAQWLSKEPEEKVSVGKKPLFQHLGWAMELKPVSAEERQQNPALRADDSWLYYLLPLLPNECIMTGIRLEGVENSAMPDEKRQVKGNEAERVLWREVLTGWLKL